MKASHIITLGFSLLLSACVTQGTLDDANSRSEALQQKLDQAASDQSRLAEKNAALQKKLVDADMKAADADRKMAELNTAPPPKAETPPPSDGSIDLVPPNAKPGQCYARLLTPAQFETKTEKVLKSAEGVKVTVTPAQYEWAEEKVIVRQESSKLEVVPATYKTVEEKQLVRAAHTVWKRGRGANEKIDSKTGDVMCLVEVPAEYRIVKSTVVDQPATTKTVVIPATYKMVKVQKLVKAAGEERETIPAVYQDVKRTTQVKDVKLEWGQVVCVTNSTPGLIGQVQTALKKNGFNPGRIDSVLGPETASAALAYQKSKGLPQSDGVIIPYDTLVSLGVATP